MSETTDAVYAILIQIAPEFSAAGSETTIKNRIDIHIVGQDSTAWGSVYSVAMAHFVAHCLTMMPITAGSAPVDTAGAVTSRRAGDLAVNYGAFTTTSASKHWLMKTSYGQEFLRLRRSRAGGRPGWINIRRTTSTVS